MALRDRIAGWLKPDQQRDDPSWVNLTSGGAQANARVAEGLSPIFACVNTISSALASLPPRLYREHEDGGREEVLSGVAFDRINEPNGWQTWPDLIEWMVGEVLLFGNSLVVIRPDGVLWPIRWQGTSVLQLESGKLRYDYAFGQGEYLRTLSSMDDSVIHLRDRTDDGIIGVSRLRRCNPIINLGHDLQDATAALWEHGAFPSGVLTLPGRLSPEQRDRLRADLAQNLSGSANRAKALLLDGGATWQRMDSTPRDSEVLASRRFMVDEICRVFEVPPPLIQSYEYNTFTNAQTAGQWFARFTLGGWARKIELVFRKMLPKTMHLELDMSAFLRADHGERWNSYDIALRNGVLQPEEVKAMEGW